MRSCYTLVVLRAEQLWQHAMGSAMPTCEIDISSCWAGLSTRPVRRGSSSHGARVPLIKQVHRLGIVCQAHAPSLQLSVGDKSTMQKPHYPELQYMPYQTAAPLKKRTTSRWRYQPGR